VYVGANKDFDCVNQVNQKHATKEPPHNSLFSFLSCPSTLSHPPRSSSLSFLSSELLPNPSFSSRLGGGENYREKVKNQIKPGRAATEKKVRAWARNGRKHIALA
jgi:hypothetical protein